MIKKYQIICVYDGNGTRHFELEFKEKKLFGGYKWVPLKTYHIRCSYTRTFKTLEEVYEYLNSLNVRRKVEHQGEIEV